LADALALPSAPAIASLEARALPLPLPELALPLDVAQLPSALQLFSYLNAKPPSSDDLTSAEDDADALPLLEVWVFGPLVIEAPPDELADDEAEALSVVDCPCCVEDGAAEAPSPEPPGA
jgi:hypothetical protein